MTRAHTFLVADDHPLFREAVTHTLESELAGSDVLEAASRTALERVLQEQADIDLVLLDLAMPGAIGFSSLLWLRSEYPQLPILVISSSDSPRVVRRAQQFGAAGFVSKAAPAGILGKAVRSVLEGGVWFETPRAQPSEHDAELRARLAQLTPQQFRVLMLIADGLFNKQIAERLDLAENTVKIHVTAILSKLACRSRTQAAVLVKTLDVDGDDVSSPED